MNLTIRWSNVYHVVSDLSFPSQDLLFLSFLLVSVAVTAPPTQQQQFVAATARPLIRLGVW